MTTFREHLNKKLKDEEFAQAYYEEREKLRIAYEIHAARTRLGWTQRQLAERAGVTQQMISRIENAMTPDVSLNTVDRISRALGLEIGLVRPSHSINPISVKVLHRWLLPSVSPAEKAVLRECQRTLRSNHHPVPLVPVMAFSVDHLNSFRRIRPVVFPANRRATRLPTLPLFTASASFQRRRSL